MTYREVLVKLATLAFENELVNENDIFEMTKKSYSKRKTREFYRVIEVLKGRKITVKNTDSWS